MTSLNPLHRVVVAVVLAVAALWACGDEPRATSRIESAVATDSSTCAFVDNTPPDVARRLEGTVMTALGPEKSHEEEGKRVSTLSVRVESPGSHTASSATALGEGIIICTGTCSGQACPAPRGCKADLGGCTPLSCGHCDGGCSQTTIFIPFDGGTADAGTPDSGTPNLQ
ncbi:hypothetical protein LXT21_02435 [Myxococcus sp. K38C18041901]|uniref:hypothetical protein n=1 Tax=Myxococcus guangdongensis TaxID=2906760 RepID=UPI0020A7F097|nr:hypothetical protein [Myxococcus guangdongensis]MCP3057629.1 hypothetical protein [Myxococcus guangdongensis]